MIKDVYTNTYPKEKKGMAEQNKKDSLTLSPSTKDNANESTNQIPNKKENEPMLKDNLSISQTNNVVQLTNNTIEETGKNASTLDFDVVNDTIRVREIISNVKLQNPQIDLNYPQNGRKYYFTISLIALNKKPKDDRRNPDPDGMNAKVSVSFRTAPRVYITIYEAAILSSVGYTVITAHFHWNPADENFIRSNMMYLDFDGFTDGSILDAQMMERLSKVGAFMYATFSSTPEEPRFRLAIPLDVEITNKDVYKRIYEEVAAEITKEFPTAKIDGSTKNACRLFFGSNSMFQILNPDYVKHIGQDHVDKTFVTIRKEIADHIVRSLSVTIPEEYKNVARYRKMAELIGEIPKGQRKLWIKLTFAIMRGYTEGIYSYEEAEYIWEPITWDSHRLEMSLKETVEDNKNKVGKESASLGSLVTEAREHGWVEPDPYGHLVPEYGEPIVKMYDKWISELGYMLELFNGERSLVNAPTGSGKTSIVMDTAINMKSNDDIFIISEPFRTIVEQLVNKKQYKGKVGCVMGKELNEETGKKKKQTTIKAKKENIEEQVTGLMMGYGERAIVCTYDVSLTVFNTARKLFPNARIHVVVDEIHKLQTDYGYRKFAISRLVHLMKDAHTFTGISGTPEELDKNLFDNEYLYQPKHVTLIIGKFVVLYTKRKQNQQVVDLIQYIQDRVALGKKLLVFIQNTDIHDGIIERIGDRVRIVSIASDRKDSPAYESIKKDATFPENIDVILTTSVIDSGISIDHHPIASETVVFCNGKSKFFSPIALKQMSNRFRDKSERFVLMLPHKEVDADIIDMNAEGLARHMVNQAYRTKEQIETYTDFEIQNFIDSIAEKDCAIYKKDDELFVDELKHRHLSYNIIRSAWLQAHNWKLVEDISKLLGMEPSYMDIASDDQELMDFWEQYEGRMADKREDEKQAFDKLVTWEHFELFYRKETDHPTYRTFCKLISDSMKNAFIDIAPIVMASKEGFELCKHLVNQATNPRKTHDVKNNIENIIDISCFRLNKRINEQTSPTVRIIKELMKQKGKMKTTSDLGTKKGSRGIVHDIANSTGQTVATVVKIYNQIMVKQESKIGNEKHFTITGVKTIEDYANALNITPQQFNNIITKYMVLHDVPHIQQKHYFNCHKNYNKNRLIDIL